MKEITKRVALSSLTTIAMLCLAGCPKNSPGVDATPPQAAPAAGNPDYQKMQQQQGAKPGGNTEDYRKRMMQGGAR